MAAPTRPVPQKAAASKQAAAKEAPAALAPPPEPKPSRRNTLVPAIVIAVALLGAAFLLRGGGGADDTPAAVPSATGEETAAGDHGDPADVVALDAITLNLSDGRFLKIGVALQLKAGLEVEDPAGFGARALDQTIDLLADYSYAELSKDGARIKAKQKVSEAVSAAYDGDVLAVYFTEFVMQ